jgi:hypothetical protein
MDRARLDGSDCICCQTVAGAQAEGSSKPAVYGQPSMKYAACPVVNADLPSTCKVITSLAFRGSPGRPNGALDDRRSSVGVIDEALRR